VKLEPVPDIPALIMKGKESWAIVADLHIGIEVQLRASGFNLPTQMPKMLESLELLRANADNLLVLGDLKHKIPNVGHREDKEIRQLMGRSLELYDRVVLVAGNHDGGVASALPEGCEAFSSRGTVIGDIGFFHGHVWPSEDVMRARSVVMGHTHPSVLMTDTLGSRNVEKCWVRARLRVEALKERYESCPEEIVIVPAFNPLLTGTPVNSDKRSMIGPFFRNEVIDISSIRVHLLDGTYIGDPAMLRRP
jgi:putative SbcD/Mre11-related phosphoesterase